MVFKRMKIRVRGSEHSKQVQDALFRQGYSWYSCDGDDKRHIHTEKRHLYAESDGTICYSDSEALFKNEKCGEYVLAGDDFEQVLHWCEASKPPIGLRPRAIASLDRLVEILEAMLRNAKEGLPIPDEWDDEYDQLREWLNYRYKMKPSTGEMDISHL